MRSMRMIVVCGVVASLLMLLVPQASHGLVLFPDFDVLILGQGQAQSCDTVTYDVKRGSGVTDAAGVVLGYGTVSRVDLRYLAQDGTYKTAIVATKNHRFDRASDGERVTLQWPFPPDANFDNVLVGTITVIVDPNNLVIEDNEGNNRDSVDCLTLG